MSLEPYILERVVGYIDIAIPSDCCSSVLERFRVVNGRGKGIFSGGSGEAQVGSRCMDNYSQQR